MTTIEPQWGVTVIGDSAVGKTSLLIRFALGKYPDPDIYVPVVAENYVVKLNSGTGKRDGGDSTQLYLWDTPGQEDYPRLRPLAYSNAHIILICFAVDNRTLLENVEERWIQEARYERLELPVLLLACKQDLRDDPIASTPGQLIGPGEGSRVAQKIAAVGYCKCSARTGKGVAEVFQTAAQKVLLHQDKSKARKSKLAHCMIF